MSLSHRVTLALLCLALAACGGPSAPPAEEAARLVAAGDLATARDVLFTATRATPDDPALRLALARVERQLGNLPDAEAAARKAMALAGPGPATLELGRVLLDMKRPLEVLELLSGTEPWPATQRLPFALLQAEAELGLPSPDSRALTRRFAQLYRERAAAAPAGDYAAFDAGLETLRRAHVEVRNAQEHASCQTAEVARPAIEPVAPGRRVLQVGPGRELATPSAAARMARAGDVIEIDAATYPADVALWTQDGLLLRGVGGRPVLDARGRAADGQGIWVFRGNDIVVENIAFRGARGPDHNAAGIRFLGRNLTVRQADFRDNENGVLTWNDPDGHVVIEHSVFDGNGDGRGYAHNIYVGRIAQFTLRFSWSRDARGGHAVKSRAASNNISYNRLEDAEDSRSSYLVDLPEGGTAIVMGNVLRKGWRALNPNAISFAAENKGTDRDADRLAVLHNSFYNRRVDAAFVANRSARPAVVANNLLAGGPATLLAGPGRDTGNARGTRNGVVDAPALDFALTGDSPLVDAGADLAALRDDLPRPQFEYLHPAGGRPRPRAGIVDVGATEFCGW